MLLIDMMLASSAPAADPLDKILPWITTFVGVVLAAVFKVQADKAKALRLEEPVPTVPTRKVFNNVTWSDLQPLISRMDRLEKHLDEVRKEQTDQFKEILEAGATRAESLRTHMDDMARAIHSRIDDLMRDHTHPKSANRR